MDAVVLGAVGGVKSELDTVNANVALMKLVICPSTIRISTLNNAPFGLASYDEFCTFNGWSFYGNSYYQSGTGYHTLHSILWSGSANINSGVIQSGSFEGRLPARDILGYYTYTNPNYSYTFYSVRWSVYLSISLYGSSSYVSQSFFAHNSVNSPDGILYVKDSAQSATWVPYTINLSNGSVSKGTFTGSGTSRYGIYFCQKAANGKYYVAIQPTTTGGSFDGYLYECATQAALESFMMGGSASRQIYVGNYAPKPENTALVGDYIVATFGKYPCIVQISTGSVIHKNYTLLANNTAGDFIVYNNYLFYTVLNGTTLTIVGVNTTNGTYKFKDYIISSDVPFTNYYVRAELSSGAKLLAYSHTLVSGTADTLSYVGEVNITSSLDEVIAS